MAPLQFGFSQVAGAAFADRLKQVHEVWSWNLDAEFEALQAAAGGESTGVVLALDMEFPGFLRQEPRSGARSVRYQALRENVDHLHPIQLGAAVAGPDGALRGVWSFNLKFDVDVDLHTEKAVAFLRAAGIDFPRHAAEGIDATVLGQRLAKSSLVGQHGYTPWWVTFSGSYDLGYLLKLLTSNRPLPRDAGAFETALSTFCPRRHELRDQLPHGSLEILARSHGLTRHGSAHTAGSDALLTLELYFSILGEKGVLREKSWDTWDFEDPWNTQDAWHHAWNNNWDPVRWENTWLIPFPGMVHSMPWDHTTISQPMPSIPLHPTQCWVPAARSVAVRSSRMQLCSPASAEQRGGRLVPDASKVVAI